MSKLELWWDPFVQSRKCMSLKFTEKLCVMRMKNNTKIEEDLTFCFKTDMRNFTNFDSSTQKSKNLCFNWLLETKVYIVWATKVQGSYPSWHWWVTQILKKNWLAVWKKTWNLAHFHQSTWKCQNWNFDRILLSKVEKVWP